jgi:hypothetical protein
MLITNNLRRSFKMYYNPTVFSLRLAFAIICSWERAVSFEEGVLQLINIDKSNSTDNKNMLMDEKFKIIDDAN